MKNIGAITAQKGSCSEKNYKKPHISIIDNVVPVPRFEFGTQATVKHCL